MGERRRKHHTVPRFYLEGFADRGQIGTAELPGTKRYVQSTREATAINDFYTVPDRDGEPSDEVEKWFSEIEGRVHPILRDVISGERWPIRDGDRDLLATWFALQFMRGPDQRAGMAHIASTMVKLQVRAAGASGLRTVMESRLGRPVKDEELAEAYARATGPGGSAIAVSSLGHMRHVLRAVPQVVPYFAGRHWQLLRFRRRTLLTSDCPVTLIPDEHDIDDVPGVGLLNAWAIAVPLDRRVALLMLGPSPEMLQSGPPPRGSLDGVLEASTGYAHLINQATVDGARRWVFHHPHDRDLVDQYHLPLPREHHFDVPNTDPLR